MRFLYPALLSTLLLLGCATSTNINSSTAGPPNMGGPTIEERRLQIASESTGDFFFGRRYYVEKTRFWGYLRKPRQPWSKAKLVIFNESRLRQPDRLPEVGPPGQRYAYDNNYQYRIRGYYTGKTAYEINSDQFLPEFMLTGYELVNKNPGWLFSPADHYDPKRITLKPR
ncbi:MAG: hypothetical protein AAGC74_06025 [Verrucomicrobiota bacterium]